MLDDSSFVLNECLKSTDRHVFLRDPARRYQFTPKWNFNEIKLDEPQIKDICDSFGPSLFGGLHPSATNVLLRWKADHRVIQAFSPSHDPSIKVAYFVLYLLNEPACNGLNRGEIQNAKMLVFDEHFAKTSSEIFGIYISILWGRDERLSQAFALQVMEHQIEAYFSESPAMRFVYARPWEPRGKTKLKRNGFLQVVPDSEVYVRAYRDQKGLHS